MEGLPSLQQYRVLELTRTPSGLLSWRLRGDFLMQDAALSHGLRAGLFQGSQVDSQGHKERGLDATTVGQEAYAADNTI